MQGESRMEAILCDKAQSPQIPLNPHSGRILVDNGRKELQWPPTSIPLH
jgi:hypothetical protein